MQKKILLSEVNKKEMLELRRFYEKTHVWGSLWSLNNKWLCDTLELPWLHNVYRQSCIREGVYRVKVELHKGLKYKVLRFENVPCREGILAHRGNSIEDSKGCILVGILNSPENNMLRQSTITLINVVDYIERNKIKYIHVTSDLSDEEKEKMLVR